MSLDTAYEAIIPGLPDDLALRCLAMLSHGYHGLLECVSKKWRNAVRSSDFFQLKSGEGWCGDWVFVLTDDQINIQWNAYDPDADRWHHLPRIPSIRCGYKHLGFSCVTVHHRFLVLGGHMCPTDPVVPHHDFSPTNDVMQFDPFKQQWNRLASMRTERSDFACAVVCGNVYVAGGWNSRSGRLDVAEVYDPLEDRWEDLPPVHILRKDCFGISYNGRFYVFRRKVNPARRNACLVFDPLDKMWHPAKDICLNAKLMNWATTISGDHFYAIGESAGNTVSARHKDEQDWHTLGKVPPVFLPNHSRPLECFRFGFTALGKNLYVVGGKVLKWNEHQKRFDIVRLDLVRVCNVSDSPLNWREARPMRGTCGAVLACAALEE